MANLKPIVLSAPGQQPGQAPPGFVNAPQNADALRAQAERADQLAKLLAPGEARPGIAGGLDQALRGLMSGYQLSKGTEAREGIGPATEAQNRLNSRTIVEALQAGMGTPAQPGGAAFNAGVSAVPGGAINAQSPAVPGDLGEMAKILAGSNDPKIFALAPDIFAAGQPKPQAPFTLNPGQERFGPGGGPPIARVPPKSDALSEERFEQNLALRQAGKSEQTINIGEAGATKGQIKLDQEFAGEYNALVAGGGFADIDKGLEQLDEAVAALASGDNLTGTFLGNLPDSIRTAINPESTNTQEIVEEVVQRNLRLILGAQFTEKEGARLIARAYNPRLDEKINAKRVKRLAGAIKSARDAKFAAAKHFERHGSLRGFEGVATFTFESLADDADLPPVDDDDFSNMTDEQILEELKRTGRAP